VFFGFSALLAVATRSTVACVFGTVLFWLMCWATNFGRHAVRSLAVLEGLPAGAGRALDLGYWLLPKPLDFHLILQDALQTGPALGGLLSTRTMAEQGLWSPGLSVLASVLCGAALLGVAAYDFLTAEY
jgi:hypothetical protein